MMVKYTFRYENEAQRLISAFVAEMTLAEVPEAKINAVIRGVVERMAGKAKTDQSGFRGAQHA